MTGKNEKKGGLSESPLFEDIAKEKLDEITQALQGKVVPARTIIFRQGDPGDSFYLINSGKVRVFRKDRDGVGTDLSQLGPGQSFGEMALLTGEPRSANVEASEETHLSVLTKDQFDRILRDYPQVSLSFVKQMSTWLVRDELKLEREAQRQFWLQGLSLFDFILIAGLTLLFGIIFNQSNPRGIRVIPQLRFEEEVVKVPPSSAMGKYVEGETLFVDARRSSFFDQQHIKGAINIPLAIFDIMYMMELSEVDKAKKIIVYGRSISSRSDEEVARKLILRGHKNIEILDGGLSTWKKKGYPVEP
ncbi:MAG: cyclic nucleotide-binding domain-containing protein [Desulfatiglandales bacterium]